jgi:hypothetical protein
MARLPVNHKQDFRQHIFESSGNYGLDINDFQLVEENEHGVDCTTWLDYLSSGEVERHSFKLVRISREILSEVIRGPDLEASVGIENRDESFDGEAFERTMEAAKEMLCRGIGEGTLARNMPLVPPTLLSMSFNTSTKNGIPFFAWPLAQKACKGSQTDGAMAPSRLLAMIDQSLKEVGIPDILHIFSARGEVAYKCRVLRSVIDEGVTSLTQEAKDALPYPEPPSSNRINRNPKSEILATLLKLSEDIFDLFFPPADWFLFPAISAYWGALDVIMRVSLETF